MAAITAFILREVASSAACELASSDTVVNESVAVSGCRSTEPVPLNVSVRSAPPEAAWAAGSAPLDPDGRSAANAASASASAQAVRTSGRVRMGCLLEFRFTPL